MPEILHQLEPGNPCVFYPDGIRAPGLGHPCLMQMREGTEFVRLVEIRGGTSTEHRSVRHVDDPIFQTSPNLRKQGAWDYSKGVVYDFGPPEKPKPPLPTDPTESLVVQLAENGKSYTEIAAQISTKGWNATRIQSFLESRTAS